MHVQPLRFLKVVRMFFMRRPAKPGWLKLFDFQRVIDWRLMSSAMRLQLYMCVLRLHGRPAPSLAFSIRISAPFLGSQPSNISSRWQQV
jgi:hypothetical protein